MAWSVGRMAEQDLPLSSGLPGLGLALWDGQQLVTDILPVGTELARYQPMPPETMARITAYVRGS